MNKKTVKLSNVRCHYSDDTGNIVLTSKDKNLKGERFSLTINKNNSNYAPLARLLELDAPVKPELRDLVQAAFRTAPESIIVGEIINQKTSVNLLEDLSGNSIRLNLEYTPNSLFFHSQDGSSIAGYRDLILTLLGRYSESVEVYSLDLELDGASQRLVSKEFESLGRFSSGLEESLIALEAIELSLNDRKEKVKAGDSSLKHIAIFAPKVENLFRGAFESLEDSVLLDKIYEKLLFISREGKSARVSIIASIYDAYLAGAYRDEIKELDFTLRVHSGNGVRNVLKDFFSLEGLEAKSKIGNSVLVESFGEYTIASKFKLNIVQELAELNSVLAKGKELEEMSAIDSLLQSIACGDFSTSVSEKLSLDSGLILVGGAAGSGKTTLAESLAGIDPRVLVAENIVSGSSEQPERLLGEIRSKANALEAIALAKDCVAISNIHSNSAANVLYRLSTILDEQSLAEAFSRVKVVVFQKLVRKGFIYAFQESLDFSDPKLRKALDARDFVAIRDYARVSKSSIDDKLFQACEEGLLDVSTAASHSCDPAYFYSLFKN